MRFMRYAWVLAAVLLAPTPCYATYMMSCDGKSPTPSLTVNLNSEMEIISLSLTGKNMDIQAGNVLFNPKTPGKYVIHQTIAQSHQMQFDLLHMENCWQHSHCAPTK
jgi:hypothetical protein